VQLRLLSAADLAVVMDMRTAIDLVAHAFARLSEGRAKAPLRTFLEVDGGTTLVMPGWVDDGPGSPPSGGNGALGAKIVSVFPGNTARNRPVVSGVVLLVDPATGEPRAALNGTWITALRTGAVSGVATRLLAREDATVLAVFGAGVQARTQIEAVRAVRPIEEVRIVSRSGASAARLAGELTGVRARAADPAQALVGCHVVVAATDSMTPVFAGAAVPAGAHVNGVGSFTPDMREVDGDLVRRATVVVDDREAAWAEAGDLIGAERDGVIGHEHVRAELGEVVRGLHPGRTSGDEVTFFKSVGNAVQDMAVAAEALRRADVEDIGVLVPL
jgi:ornithine cyclodeaminase